MHGGPNTSSLPETSMLSRTVQGVPVILVLDSFKNRVIEARLTGLELRREFFDSKPWRC